MKIEIVMDGFSCPFSDMVDKNLFETIATEKEDVWVVKRLPLSTGEIKNPNSN